MLSQVDFKKLRYNLHELFHNTPVFDVPPIDFEMEDVRGSTEGSEEEAKGSDGEVFLRELLKK